MVSLINLIDLILGMVTYLVIISAVMSWLIGFGVINIYNPFVNRIYTIVERLTHPLFAPFRRFIPNMGGLDLSPIALLLTIFFLRNLLREYGLGLAGY